jgi:hypothetical protein
MSSQRYERVRTTDSPRNPEVKMFHGQYTDGYIQLAVNDEADSPSSPTEAQIPSSPPPSFRSRASSPTSRHSNNAPVDQNLADTFDADGSEDEDNDGDDRQRLMRGTPTESVVDTAAAAERPVTIERRPTQFPVFTAPRAGTGRVYGGGSGSDGVFANLSAKPETGEKTEEHPPVSPSPYHMPKGSKLTSV